MLYLGGESTPCGRQLRQPSSSIHPVDIMTSCPPPPSVRALNKDYYFMRNSSTEQRISDKLETHNSCSVLQDFSEDTTPSSAHANESIATGKFHKQFKTAILNHLYWRAVVFGSTSACSGLLEISDRNLGSMCGQESEYFKQFETVKNILPKFCRMPHEHQQANSEQSTENHEVSFGMVPVPHSIATTKGLESIQTTCDATRHKNGSVKSMSLPMEYNTNHGMLNKGLLDNLKLGEKRKLQCLTSEDIVSGFNDRKEKRFKSDETQSIYNRNGSFNELKKPFYFGEKSIYCNPSFKQNAYSTSNGLNGISKDVTRKLGFNFNALSNNMSKHLSGFKPEEATVNQEKTGTLNLQASPVDLEIKLRRVGETESMSHGMKAGASFSKITQEKTSVSSQEFISLDSTKYSFLTQMKKMRENAERPAIPCPFCSESFSEYLDLKLHVQTHKYANISGNGIKRYERSLNENQSPVSPNGNSMLTPISSPVVHTSPRPPSHVPGNGDDCMIRATSVIHFAEKKKESAGK